jgi:hypothetical protein
MNSTRKSIVAGIVLLLSFPAISQVHKITGQLNDLLSNATLTGAHVYLFNDADSLIRATITDDAGKFLLERIRPGNYKINFSFVGYKHLTKPIPVSNQDVNLGSIGLAVSSTDIREVSVTGIMPLAQQKGDTTEFNADAFTTMPDATAEDLVEKLPGVTVEDGKVEAMGEEVKQVLVDGRPFFRNDPTAALRTLPAEVIERIQIFDKESDQAEFTGFSTGETQKAMNIITRPSMRNGIFGKAYAGYGFEDMTLSDAYQSKYAAGGNVNWFNGARRITLVAQSNNVNQQNFSAGDLLGVMAMGQRGGARGGSMMGGPGGGGLAGTGGAQDERGGGGRTGGNRTGGPGGGDISEFMVGQQKGISTTHSAGINYSDLWGQKVEVTGSYFFNLSDNNSIENLTRSYTIGTDSGQVYNELSETGSRNVNHRANLRLQYNINENNAIFLRPRLTIQHNEGVSSFLGETSKSGNRFNEIDNMNRSDLSALNFSNNLMYRHRFAKERRSLTVNLTTDFNDHNGESQQYALTRYLTTPAYSDELDQESTLFSTGWSFSGNLMYSEPIGDHATMMLNYAASYQKDDSEKKTNNYYSPDQDYTELDTLTSNVFHDHYVTQRMGGSYQYFKNKIMFVGRLQFQSANLSNRQVFPSEFDMQKNFQHVLVNAVFRYRPSRQRNINIVYRTYTMPPSIDQLQEVVDNSDPLQLSTGNADLRPSYTHTAFIRFSNINTQKTRIFFLMLNASYTDDYIANSTFLALQDTLLPSGILVKEGTQLVYPVNLDNYWNIRSFAVYGMPVNGIRSNLNFNLGISHTKIPGLANNKVNHALTTTFSAGLTLSSNISEYLDFSISLRPNYNIVRNALNTTQNENYFDQQARFRFKGVLPNSGFFLESMLTNRFYEGLSEDYNQHYWLWNAAIGRKIFRNKLGELKAGIYDILNQNRSIQRIVSDIYVEDIQNNILQRYFMFTFTYNLRSFKGAEPGPGPEDFRQPFRPFRPDDTD